MVALMVSLKVAWQSDSRSAFDTVTDGCQLRLVAQFPIHDPTCLRTVRRAPPTLAWFFDFETDRYRFQLLTVARANTKAVMCFCARFGTVACFSMVHA